MPPQITGLSFGKSFHGEQLRYTVLTQRAFRAGFRLPSSATWRRLRAGVATGFRRITRLIDPQTPRRSRRNRRIKFKVAQSLPPARQVQTSNDTDEQAKRLCDGTIVRSVRGRWTPLLQEASEAHQHQRSSRGPEYLLASSVRLPVEAKKKMMYWRASLLPFWTETETKKFCISSPNSVVSPRGLRLATSEV